MTSSEKARHATRIVPLVVACPLFMVNLDSSILLTAIPTMARSMGLNAADLTSLITAYLIALAVSMPLSGWASDRLGSKTVFIASVIVFTVGSILCSMATSLPMMIVARVIQGAGGGMMTPVARIVLLSAVPKSELVSAMAWYTTPALLGPVIGPSIGGLIVEHFSWPLVFLVNLPFGAITLLAAFLLLKNEKAKFKRQFDGLGFLLLGGGLVVLLASFDGLKGNVTTAIAAACGIILGLLLLSGYTRHAKAAAAPLINLSILKDRTYAPTLWGGSVFRLGTAALPFLLSIILQSNLFMSPSIVGLLLSFVAFGAMCAKPVAPWIISALGYRGLLIANALASSAIMALLAVFSSLAPTWLIAIGLGISGLLRSIQFTALNSLAYFTVPKEQIGSASTLSSIAQQVSIGFGVVLANIFITGIGTVAQASSLEKNVFALLAIAMVCSISAMWFTRLEKTAGEEALNRLSN
jgi:EmrB/QacA subfamily drug resistance transporter